MPKEVADACREGRSECRHFRPLRRMPRRNGCTCAFGVSRLAFLFELECEDMDDPFQALHGFALVSQLAGQCRDAFLKSVVFLAEYLNCPGDMTSLR